MLTCNDLDEFIERACDITRQMPGRDRIREAGELLTLIETVPQRFIMQWRAAETADQHYLRDQHLRAIAREQNLSFQAVSFWLQNHGPRHYLVLARESDDAPVTAALITVDGEATKKKVKQYRAAGRRVVPATFNAVDADAADGLAADINLAELWDQVGEWEALQQQS